MAPHSHKKEEPVKNLITSVAHTNQYNRSIKSFIIICYQQEEASVRQQQGFEPIGEILNHIFLIQEGGARWALPPAPETTNALTAVLLNIAPGRGASHKKQACIAISASGFCGGFQRVSWSLSPQPNNHCFLSTQDWEQQWFENFLLPSLHYMEKSHVSPNRIRI